MKTVSYKSLIQSLKAKYKAKVKMSAITNYEQVANMLFATKAKKAKEGEEQEPVVIDYPVLTLEQKRIFKFAAYCFKMKKFDIDMNMFEKLFEWTTSDFDNNTRESYKKDVTKSKLKPAVAICVYFVYFILNNKIADNTPSLKDEGIKGIDDLNIIILDYDEKAFDKVLKDFLNKDKKDKKKSQTAEKKAATPSPAKSKKVTKKNNTDDDDAKDEQTNSADETTTAPQEKSKKRVVKTKATVKASVSNDIDEITDLIEESKLMDEVVETNDADDEVDHDVDNDADDEEAEKEHEEEEHEEETEEEAEEEADEEAEEEHFTKIREEINGKSYVYSTNTLDVFEIVNDEVSDTICGKFNSDTKKPELFKDVKKSNKHNKRNNEATASDSSDPESNNYIKNTNTNAKNTNKSRNSKK